MHFFFASSALLLRFKCSASSALLLRVKYASSLLDLHFFSASSALILCFKCTSSPLQVHFFSASSALILCFKCTSFSASSTLLLCFKFPSSPHQVRLFSASSALPSLFQVSLFSASNALPSLLQVRFYSASSALLRFKCAFSPLEVCFFSASSALLLCFKCASFLLQERSIFLKQEAYFWNREARSLSTPLLYYASVLSCSCLANILIYNFYLIVILLEHYRWVKQKIETTLLFNKRRQRQYPRKVLLFIIWDFAVWPPSGL